jgi:hypothetical protein
VLLCDRGSAGKGTQRRGHMCGVWRRREVAGGDHATAAPARAWAGTRGYGPTCATGKRAPSLILFPKFQNQHKLCNSIG